MKYAGGHVLGRYELLVPIASGGMAEVWAARLRGCHGFQKIVAIKTIRAGAIDDERMVQMFLEEAALASQIHHPNVVEILELGEDEGNPYLVMDWVDGEPLSFIIKQAAARGGIPLPVAVNLIGQACKGLHAAHNLRDESGALLGVVHRDISPPNVLVTYSGTAKVADFGIAKAMARGASHTNDGELKGKFSYVAPEQVGGGAVDRRADIFSMGILLYLLTTGHHPFPGNHPAEILKNICSKKAAVRPSEIVEGYPLELEAMVLKALSKAPEDRWATANDMLAALESAMPQSMDGSFEIKIAAYMHDLFGERSRDRKAQLRLAQELADQSQSVRLRAAASVGSLGAIAVDKKGPPSSSRMQTSSSEIAIEDSLRDSPVPSPHRARFGKAPWVLAALAIVLVLAIPLTRSMRSKTVDRAAAAAATIQLPIEPPSQPTPPITPPASSATPVASTAVEDPQQNATRLRKGAPSIPRSVPSKAPSAPVSPATSVGKALPSAPEEHPPAARDRANPSLWDNRF